MSFKFPYTNFQELNLDWIIKKVKDLSKQIESDSSIVSEYIDRLIAVEEKADNADATATAADARATGANNTANSAITLATQAKQTADIADLQTTLLDLKIGNLSSLFTTAKDTVVNAINEVWSIFHNATAVTNVTPAGTDPAVTYNNGVFTFDLPEGGDPDAVTHAELDAAIDDVEDTIDELTDRVDDLSEELDNKADVIIDTASGDVASFPDGTATPLKALIVNVEPVQAGTGTPSPSNIRPISGRTGCEVMRTGENLLDPGEMIEYGSGAGKRWYYDDGFTLKANQPYTFSVTYDTPPIYLYIINKATGEHLSEANNVVRYTPTEDTTVYFQAYKSSGMTDAYMFKLELGSTATAYEEYRGNSYSVTFGETVYGAKPDIISGEMPVTWMNVNAGDYPWKYITNDGQPYFVQDFVDKKPGLNVMCSVYKTARETGTGSLQDKEIGGSTNSGRIFIKDSDYTDINTFIAAMNGVQICYELATPTETTITPVPVTALKGYNNIWSDAGSVDVTYRADTKGYIDKLIAQVQALALGG